MTMIRTLRIQGFKSIYSESIELGRINCFIGANGVGKSNVLEALGVLGAAANVTVHSPPLSKCVLRVGRRLSLPKMFIAGML